MEVTFLNIIISSVVTGLITGVAAFAAIRVEMKFLRRDVDHAHRRVDAAHKRIDKITKMG